MDEEFENFTNSIFIAKIKKVTYPWHEFLKDKILIVGELCKHYNLLGIKDDKDWVKNLCNYIYKNDKETFNDLGYQIIDEYISECKCGNDGFGFYKDEIEIIGKLSDEQKRSK